MRDPKKSDGATPATRESNGSETAASDTSTDGGYNAGMAVFSYIIGGIVVWSLIGWGLDYLWGTRWFVLAGALLGALGGFYLSHMHGLTSSRKNADERHAPSAPSQDGKDNAK